MSGELIRRVLDLAARAPSGGNLQPWRVHVVGGEALGRLKSIMRRRTQETSAELPLDYDIYPPTLKQMPQYADRPSIVAEKMYGLLAIGRDQKDRRKVWFRNNFLCFGAPLVFTSIDRRMGPPQWADMGMFLQNVMLLLRAEGLDSCAQECWALYPRTVGQFLALAPEQTLFCGMPIGYEDAEAAMNTLRTPRTPREDFARFLGI